MSKTGKRHKKRGTVIALLLLVCAFALYPGIVTRRYTVESGKLAADEAFRVAVVADLHSHVFGRDQAPLTRRLQDAAPDAVLLVGDIYDDRIPPDGVRLLLEGLRGGPPVYYVTGNHEYWTHDMAAVYGLFAEYGVTILDDRWERATLGGVPVVLGGVSDPVRAEFEPGYSAEDAAANAFRELPEDCFSILLAHRPTWYDRLYRTFPFDLTVSGHNHGGQVRIPGLLNGLAGPDEGWLPQYPGGRYDDGDQTLLVSRGLAVYWWLPRVCDPPELVLVDVKGKESKDGI